MNPAQPPFPTRILLASAGTGKTFQLSQQYLKLLGHGVDPARILAATFTRKAAGEIHERLLLRLARAARGELALDVFWSIDQTESSAAPVARAGAWLKTLCTQPERARIATLDATFLRAIRQREFELGLPVGWSLADEVEEEQRLVRALITRLGRIDLPERLELLRLLARAPGHSAVHSTLLSIAADVLDIARDSSSTAFEALLPAPFPPASEVEQAATALQQCLAPLTKKGAPNASWQKALDAARCAWSAGDPGGFLEDALVVRAGAGEWTYYKLEFPAQLGQALVTLARHAAAILSRNVVQRTLAARRWCASLAEELDQAALERGMFTHDDLSRLWSSAANQSPQDFTEAFAADHLLLDEFQDTSPLQFRVLESEIRRLHGKPGTSVFVVGDPKQSIYRWRGADEKLLLELPALLDTPAEHLAFNRRSSQVVLDLVQLVFGELPELPLAKEGIRASEHAQAFQSFARSYTPARRAAELPALPGAARVRFADETETEPKAHGPLAELPAELAQALSCARSLAARDWGSVAILVRSRKWQARLVFELGRMGVAASMDGGSPLTDSSVVQVLLAALTFAEHPDHSVAFFHAATSSVAAALGLEWHTKDPARRAQSARLRARIQTLGLPQFLEEVWQALLECDCSAFDRQRVEQLTLLARRAGGTAAYDLGSFIERVHKERVERPGGTRVRVMTIHRAKGLEFDAVVLPLSKASWSQNPSPVLARRPSGRALAPYEIVSLAANKFLRAFWPELSRLESHDYQSQVLEELCTLYVAMTRARSHLEVILPPESAHKEDSKDAEKSSAAGRSVSNSSAGLVQAALEHAKALTGGSWQHEDSVPEWLVEVPAPAQSSKPPKPAALPKPQPALPKLPVQDERALPLAPAQWEIWRHGTGGDWLGGDPRARWRGKLWHAWLAQAEWIDSEPFAEREALVARAVELGFPAPLARQEVQQFQQHVAAPAVVRILDRRYMAELLGSTPQSLEVWRERAFAVEGARLGQAAPLVRGSYDRVVIARSASGRAAQALVLDFKLDHVADPAGARRRAEHHRPQMEIYRAAIGLALELAPEAIRAFLVFLRVDAVIDLDLL